MTRREEYRQLLATPEWKAKRREIYKRDGYRCVDCGANGIMIDCHHLYYVGTRNPWDYPASHLVTLCRECHWCRHQERIPSFPTEEAADPWFEFTELDAQMTEQSLAERHQRIGFLEDRGAVWEEDGRFWSFVDDEGRDRFFDEDGEPM